MSRVQSEHLLDMLQTLQGLQQQITIRDEEHRNEVEQLRVDRDELRNYLRTCIRRRDTTIAQQGQRIAEMEEAGNRLQQQHDLIAARLARSKDRFTEQDHRRMDAELRLQSAIERAQTTEQVAAQETARAVKLSSNYMWALAENCKLRDKVEEETSRADQAEERAINAEERATVAEAAADEQKGLVEATNERLLEAEAQAKETEKRASKAYDRVRKAEEKLETVNSVNAVLTRSRQELISQAKSHEGRVRSKDRTIERLNRKIERLQEKLDRQHKDAQEQDAVMQKLILRDVIAAAEGRQARLQYQKQARQNVIAALPGAWQKRAMERMKLLWDEGDGHLALFSPVGLRRETLRRGIEHDERILKRAKVEYLRRAAEDSTERNR